MILRQLSQTSYKKIDIPKNITELEFIKINPEFIIKPDLYSGSGYYLDNNGVLVVDSIKELEFLQAEKMRIISDKFSDMMVHGSLDTSLGFTIDNRRGDGKDDKDNVNSLIDLGNEPVYFKDTSNNFHVLTLQDLKTIKQEMIQDGLNKYQWKWQKQNEVMQSTTIDELYAIQI
jgi:hypothetical protein